MTNTDNQGAERVHKWWEVIEGDCREVMAGLEPESVDAIVCDPPYELGFMGKGWDSAGVSFEVATWQAAWRILKPGGHLLAFGGTRTYHRIAVAIEDAGFEIRDCLSWLYGSGFPKSLDVSKAIDKRRDDTDPALAVTRWLNAQVKRAGMRYAEILAHFGFNEGSGQIGHWTALSIGAQPAVPTWPQWLELKALLGFGDDMDAEVWRLNGRKGQPGEAWHEREVIAERTGSARPGFSGDRYGEVRDAEFADTAPATPEAAQWAGWGTALKPAWEPVIVARKPLGERTVAANVLQHGTGALNIDGCRIAGEPIEIGLSLAHRGGKYAAGTGGRGTSESYTNTQGRWPANVALDEAAAAMLDAQSGERPTGAIRPYEHRSTSDIYGGGKGWHTKSGRITSTHEASTGGASRFFYVAKASRRERNAGLEGMPERDAWAEAHGDHGKFAVFEHDGRERKPVANHHPTVKPIALMRWLVRLVTPPGGLVVDPFNGSGSTGIAAVLEGFRYIGIEQSAEYAEIARRRIAHWEAERLAELEAAQDTPAQLTLDVA